MRTKEAGVQERNMRERDVAARGCPNTGRSGASDGDALEELFRWGAKVATEQNLTVEKLDAILKAVRDRLREQRWTPISVFESVNNLRGVDIMCNNSGADCMPYSHDLVAEDMVPDKRIPAFLAATNDKFRTDPKVKDIRVKIRPEERSAVFWVFVWMPKYDHRLMKELVGVQLDSMAIASECGWVTEYMFIPLPHVDPDQIDINERPSDYLP